MSRFFRRFLKLVRRAEKAGYKVTYKITIEKDGESGTMASEGFAASEYFADCEGGLWHGDDGGGDCPQL